MGSIISSLPHESQWREWRDPRAAAAPCPAPGDPELDMDAFYCPVCLEVLCDPVRTRCRHVFCRSCLAASVENNAYTCPYCRTHLLAGGVPAFDIIERMKIVFKDCDECNMTIRLSEMRSHQDMCELYIKKYGPLEELGKGGGCEYCYACPYCQSVVELDEDGLVLHCATVHRFESSLVVCPICHLSPGGDPSYMRTLAMHLHSRHTHNYEDYIVLW